MNLHDSVFRAACLSGSLSLGIVAVGLGSHVLLNGLSNIDSTGAMANITQMVSAYVVGRGSHAFIRTLGCAAVAGNSQEFWRNMGYCLSLQPERGLFNISRLPGVVVEMLLRSAMGDERGEARFLLA